MKKTFVSTCAAALLAASASTAFAAANPFEDVPADHWAYDAVAQLAANGVIEGYGDGTYRGDQAITRYEMAQMVAKAMAKNPSGADKAMIDKLAAEFADELNNLGVRVANLEKKVDNVKFGGTVRYRYKNGQTYETGEAAEKFVAQYLTLRLEPSMQINEHWSGHARIDYNADMNSAANVTGANNILDAKGEIVEPGVNVDRIWAQGDYKNFQLLLGKLPYVTFIDRGMIYDDSVAGGQLTLGNKIRATLTVGRSHRYDQVVGNPYLPAEIGKPGKTGSYQAVEIYNDRADKWTWGVGFHRWANDALLSHEARTSAVNIWEAGLGYKFDKNFSLHGAYAWTTNPAGEPAEPAQPAAGGQPAKPAEPEESATSDSKRAWSIELDYKGADPADKGSWGAFVAYRHLGQYAVLAPTYDAMGAGLRGVELGVDYVFAKNVMGTVKYFFGKEMQDEYELNGEDQMLKSARVFFAELNFFF